MSQLDGFRGDYSPGGGSGGRFRRKWAQASGRKGGLACAAKRRQLAKGTRRTRDGGLGIPKAYAPVPKLSVEASERVFRRLCDAEGRRFNRGGFETFDAVYRLLLRWSIVKGQGFEITDENVSAALQALGRPHSRRTVQYTTERLKRAGVVQKDHVKRSGARRIPGRMDTIRIHLRRVSTTSINCTPPLRGTGQRSYVASWPVCDPKRKRTTEPPPASSPPASPAERVAADAANGNDGTETGGVQLSAPPPPEDAAAARITDLEEQLRFTEMKIRLAPSLGSSAIHRRRQLLMEIRALRDGRSPSLRWRGDPC